MEQLSGSGSLLDCKIIGLTSLLMDSYLIICVRLSCCIALLSWAALPARADSLVFFTNFGADIVRPIFPANGSVDIYEAKTDKKPRRQFREQDALSVEGDWKSCVESSVDGWVRCSVRGTTGWVKRNTFRSAAEYAPVEKWPFRYWLHLASTPSAGEGYHETLVAARKNPYLVKPAEFESVFFTSYSIRKGGQSARELSNPPVIAYSWSVTLSIWRRRHRENVMPQRGFF